MNNQNVRGYTARKAHAVAKNIRSCETIINVLWIVIGVIQCCAIATIVAGVWNIYNAVVAIKNQKSIQPHTPWVVGYYKNRQSSLIIALFINLFLGGVVGVVLVIAEFILRSYALKNADAFEFEAVYDPNEVYDPAVMEKSNGVALGVTSLLLSFMCGGFVVVSPILAIVSLLQSFSYAKAGGYVDGAVKTGRVMSIISIVIPVLYVLLYLVMAFIIFPAILNS